MHYSIHSTEEIHALSKDSAADFNHHPASVVHSTVTPRVDWKSALASLEKVECIG